MIEKYICSFSSWNMHPYRSCKNIVKFKNSYCQKHGCKCPGCRNTKSPKLDFCMVCIKTKRCFTGDDDRYHKKHYKEEYCICHLSRRKKILLVWANENSKVWLPNEIIYMIAKYINNKNTLKLLSNQSKLTELIISGKTPGNNKIKKLLSKGCSIEWKVYLDEYTKYLNHPKESKIIQNCLMYGGLQFNWTLRLECLVSKYGFDEDNELIQECIKNGGIYDPKYRIQFLNKVYIHHLKPNNHIPSCECNVCLDYRSGSAYDNSHYNCAICKKLLTELVKLHN